MKVFAPGPQAGAGWSGRQSSLPNPGTWRAMSSETEIRPFRVEMPEEAVADLRRRIAAARLPSKELVEDRSQGVQLATIQELARYWTTDYDWRTSEAQAQRAAAVQDRDRWGGHPLHPCQVAARERAAVDHHPWLARLGHRAARSRRPAHRSDGARRRAEDAFHLVLPSIPGYGFSGEPTEVGWNAGRTAQAWAELMQRLGYTRYVAQGGDVGASITDAMGRQAPAGLAGIHTNLLVTGLGGGDPGEHRGGKGGLGRAPHSARAASATSWSRPHGRRRSATPCWIHPSPGGLDARPRHRQLLQDHPRFR